MLRVTWRLEDRDLTGRIITFTSSLREAHKTKDNITLK